MYKKIFFRTLLKLFFEGFGILQTKNSTDFWLFLQGNIKKAENPNDFLP